LLAACSVDGIKEMKYIKKNSVKEAATIPAKKVTSNKNCFSKQGPQGLIQGGVDGVASHLPFLSNLS